MSRLLVVNADDMGLTPGVCRAVMRAHATGIVTSTSVLAVGMAFDQAANAIREADELGVGVHLAVVGEDRPLLSAREVPTLVDQAGNFPLSYRMFVARGVAGRIDADDVAREFRAQLDRVRDIGAPITHLDTHQHIHLWPAVLSVVIDLAREAGIRCVRLPTSRRPGPLGVGVRLLTRRARRELLNTSLLTTDGFAGLDEAGALDRQRFAVALDSLTESPAMTAEINTHPTEVDDPEFVRFAWGYRGGDELAMLTDPATRDLVMQRGWRLGTYADVAASA